MRLPQPGMSQFRRQSKSKGKLRARPQSGWIKPRPEATAAVWILRIWFTSIPALRRVSKTTRARKSRLLHKPLKMDQTGRLRAGNLRRPSFSNQATPDTPSSLFFGELATAYVPWQTFGQTLSLREALRTGTLFPELVRNVPLYQKPPGT